MTVRVKICGMQGADDARRAIDAGADLIGINFVPSSRRHVELATAEEIARAAEGQVERVALFQDAPTEEIERVLRRIEFERVQLHGTESEDEVEALDLPVIKAIRGVDLELAEQYPGAMLLLDHPTGPAGGGEAWDWSAAEELIAHGYDVLLAGGLSPDNIGDVLALLSDALPWGVDVASGVEDAAGTKDPERMRAFVGAVRRAAEVEAE